MRWEVKPKSTHSVRAQSDSNTFSSIETTHKSAYIYDEHKYSHFSVCMYTMTTSATENKSYVFCVVCACCRSKCSSPFVPSELPIMSIICGKKNNYDFINAFHID